MQEQYYMSFYNIGYEEQSVLTVRRLYGAENGAENGYARFT